MRTAIGMGGPGSPQTTDSFGNPAGNVVFSEHKFAISGTLKTYVLAPDDADAADAAAERINDSTGFKAFRVFPHMPAAASFEGIIFGWSTTAGDLSAINTAMGLADASLVTPDGVQIENVGIILPNVIGAVAVTQSQIWTGNTEWITYDGTTNIKTIAVRSSGANHDAGVVVQVIA